MIFNPTSRARVRDVERHWLAKFLLRIAALLISIVAIGCIGWAFGEYRHLYNLQNDAENDGGHTYGYYDVYDWTFLPWDFITLGLSVIWSVINIAFRLKRVRPIHPGLNVAFDLILWLGLLGTGLCALASAWENLSYNPSDDEPYSETSQYYTYPNGTTVLVQGRYGEFTNGTYGFIPDSSLGYNSTCDGFGSCAEQSMVFDAAVHWGRVVAAGAGLTFAAALLHFITFVWACVDTHRRNSKKVDRRAEVIAQRIIADMQERGVIPAYNQHVPNSPGAAMQAMPLLGVEQVTEPGNVRTRDLESYPQRNMSGALHTTAHELDSGANSRERNALGIGRYESSESNSTTHTNPAPALRERHPDHTLNSPRMSQGFHRGRTSAPAPLSLAGSRRVSQESSLASPGLPGNYGSAYVQVQQRDVSPVSVTPRGSRMRLSDVPQREEPSREHTPTGRAM